MTNHTTETGKQIECETDAQAGVVARGVASALPTDPGMRFLERLGPLFAMRDEASILAFLRSPEFDLDPADFLDHPSAQVVQVAAICLGLLGEFQHTHRLIELLQHDDYFVVSAVEKSIWSIWMRSSTPRCVKLLQRAGDCIQSERFREANGLLDRILIEDPHFAEACNQRAILLHLTGNYELSIMACHRTLALNPHHFGAAAGLGHNCFHLGQYEDARIALHKALDIHPRMEGIRQAIRRCNLASGEIISA
ncbi:MAG: tetratricopeptide repeat protein [Planctomycetes bacterium]|nr:tetratricopeptide repeat protein [Planctomycetota bacterium]